MCVCVPIFVSVYLQYQYRHPLIALSHLPSQIPSIHSTYRERMFHIAWRVGVASVADLSIAFVCWREALRLLASEKTFTKMLMLKVHRKGLELEKKGKDESERSQYNTTALEIYRFCHTHVTYQYDVHKSQPSTLLVFSSAYVDWLQHFSSLSEYVGNLKEAKAFLKTAHGYVAAFVSINPR